jgi:hypothetical protein
MKLSAVMAYCVRDSWMWLVKSRCEAVSAIGTLKYHGNVKQYETIKRSGLRVGASFAFQADELTIPKREGRDFPSWLEGNGMVGCWVSRAESRSTRRQHRMIAHGGLH